MKIPTNKRGKFKKAVKDERNHRKPNGRGRMEEGERFHVEKMWPEEIARNSLGITHYSTQSIGPQYTGLFMELLKE